MDDQQQQHISQMHPVPVTTYTQMRPVVPQSYPSPSLSQNEQAARDQKKQIYQAHQHQQWIRNSSPSMSAQPQQYSTVLQQSVVGHQQFITTTSPDNQLIMSHHSPLLIQQSTPTAFGASPSSIDNDQRRQTSHQKANFSQATRLQNYQMQPQQQFHRQRQMEIIDSGQIQRQQIINATTVNKNIPLHFQEHQQQQPQLSQAYKEHPEMIVPSNVVHSQQIYGQSGQVLTPHPMVEGMQMQPIKTQPSIRIRQTGSHMHPAPPPPLPPPQSNQQQRILVHHQNPMVDGCFSDPIPPAPLPTPSVPTPYIGSHRFSVLIETDPQNISPKKKYRDLKKKFKYLVYENEYYQEELRNLQRKLLKLSRDKNFLLDRLGQYENLSETSDDSDSSVKTLEDKGTQKTKRKQKQASFRKRAAPNSAQNSVGAKRSTPKGGNINKKKVEPEKGQPGVAHSQQNTTTEDIKVNLKQEQKNERDSTHLESALEKQPKIEPEEEQREERNLFDKEIPTTSVAIFQSIESANEEKL